MIYLNNTIKEQEIFIPKTIDREVWKVSLQIKSTISSDNFSIDGVVGNCSALYYSMMVALSEKIVSGEYEYTLSDEVGVLSTGLLVIGDLESSTEYNKDIAYEQYTE